VGNLVLVFHFSIRPRHRSCGNVGISLLFGEISKGLVERGGSLILAFHAFHSPGISTALLVRDRRRAVNRWRIHDCCSRHVCCCDLLRFGACTKHQTAGNRGTPFLHAAL
jgi:hypothetical protein